MEKKYEFTRETMRHEGRTLHRIRALKDFGNVKAGDVGGWVETEANLSHDCNAWVSGNGRVYDNAWVYDNACVSGNGEIYGNAWVSGNGRVYGAEDYITCGPIGSRGDITTIFRDSVKKVCVNCGCFSGTLDEFEKAVKTAHGDTNHGKEYVALIALARIRFYHMLNEAT